MTILKHLYIFFNVEQFLCKRKVEIAIMNATFPDYCYVKIFMINNYNNSPGIFMALIINLNELCAISAALLKKGNCTWCHFMCW